MNSKKKILVVDDEKAISDALRDKLTFEGFEVLVAHDGGEGFVMALNEKPDLILLDVIMPKVDGITMLTNLREDAWGKNVKVIMLTNVADEEKIGESLEHKVYDYLIKTDWKIQEVVEKVRSKLNLPPHEAHS